MRGQENANFFSILKRFRRGSKILAKFRCAEMDFRLGAFRIRRARTSGADRRFLQNSRKVLRSSPSSKARQRLNPPKASASLRPLHLPRRSLFFRKRKRARVGRPSRWKEKTPWKMNFIGFLMQGAPKRAASPTERSRSGLPVRSTEERTEIRVPLEKKKRKHFFSAEDEKMKSRRSQPSFSSRQ